MDMDPGLAQHLDRGHDHLNPTHPTTPDRKNPVDKPAQTGSTNTPTTKTDTKPTIRSIRHSQTPHIGGSRLNWREVEPLIREAFADAPDVDVLLFPPSGAPAAVAIKPTPMPPTMTPGRAALVALIRQYTDQSWNPPGLIETQKLMYFLQVAGEPLRLHFAANRYGPYADNLRHVLTAVEGHYLSGFGDGSAHVTQAEPLRVMPGAIEEATAVLARHSQTSERIDHVLELAAGFESAYGLELLATVHWLADRAEQEERRSDDLVVRQVADWSPRKAKMFTDRHIRIAIETLRAQGWLAGDAVAD